MKRNLKVWLRFSLVFIILWLVMVIYLAFNSATWPGLMVALFGSLFYFIPSYCIYSPIFLVLLLFLNIMKTKNVNPKLKYFFVSVLFSFSITPILTSNQNIYIEAKTSINKILLVSIIMICTLSLTWFFVKEFEDDT